MSASPQSINTIIATSFAIRTQDNRITSEPIFVVEERDRIWGIEEGYHHGYVWHHLDEDYREADDAEAEGLDRMERDGNVIPPWWHMAFYVDRWRFVSAFFTELAADAYIEANAHNLTDPRVFVYSGHRNREWVAMRDILLNVVEGVDPVTPV